MEKTCLASAGAMPLGAYRLRRTPQEPQAAECRFIPGLRRAHGHSGRLFCRMYSKGQIWVLELEPASGGWLRPEFRKKAGDEVSAPLRFTFPTLGAAIGYAEHHEFDYRIIWRPQHRRSAKNHRATCLPRSWMARLSRNGRNGDMYHG